MAVDEEADLGELGEGGVEGADDGEQGEVFGFDAGGVGVGEGAVEVDEGELTGGDAAEGGGVGVGAVGVEAGDGEGEEEDIVDGGAGGEGVEGSGQGVLGEEAGEEDAGAGGGLFGEGDVAGLGVMELSESLARKRVVGTLEAEVGAAMGVSSAGTARRAWASTQPRTSRSATRRMPALRDQKRTRWYFWITGGLRRG